MRVFFIFFLLIQNLWLFAQTNIYTSITSPSTLVANTTDEFEVTNITGFNAGDKVLIIQMQGAEITTTDDSSYGDITNIGNAGNYEFAYICQISGTTITLTSPLLKDYDVMGKVQMITVPQYSNHTINTLLNASQDWNGDTGGILVFEVSGTLSLNADIDLTGQGFRGGEISDNDVFCSSATTSASITNYVSNDPSLAGGKGESIAITSPDRARGNTANGGGGGNTFEAGGGGGGNAGTGGLGGFGKNSSFVTIFCTGVNSTSANPDKQGIGGTGLDTYFTNDKIFLGGGGGGGQATNGSLAAFGTQISGKGGGIVIIVADEIVGNGHNIITNGESVLPTPFASAGSDGNSGAGAGGTILLDINTYTTTLNLQAKGGNGGNTFSGNGNHYAPGGGGGGGLIWVSGTTLPSTISNLSIDISGGIAGISNNGSVNDNFGATNGSIGSELNNLSIPANGGTSLAGIYTIGGTSPDFPDLETAISQINSAGLSADVTLNLRNGIYIESSDNVHTLDNYKVCTNAATLTIQSESGNPDDVIIQTNSTTSTALSLKNLNNVVLNNLTLENTQGVIATPDEFNDAFLAENAEATLNNIKVVGDFELTNSSILTLAGVNNIESGNLLISANLTNQGTMNIGGVSGGNIHFQTDANFVNIGSNNVINFQGRTWIEDVSSAVFDAGTGQVNFNSTSLIQEIQAGTNTNTFYNLIIDNNQNVILQANIKVDNNLNLINGILNTNSNEVIFTTNYPESNNPAETNTSHIQGLARMENKSVGTGNLNFLGINITGSDNIADVSILRNTGTNAIQSLPDGANSIACTWSISVSQQPNTSRQVAFTWLDIFDNANIPDNITIWQKESSDWTSLEENINANTNPRQTPNITITNFAEFTLGNQNIDLLSLLENFDGTKIDIQNNNLFWSFSDVSAISELVLEKSSNNIDFSNLASFIDLNAENFEDTEGLGSFYYRLKIIGVNGFEVYSDTIFLEAFDKSFTLLPNPFNESLSIQTTFPQSLEVSFTLTDLKGQKITSFHGTLENLNIFLQNLASTLPQAMYISETKIDGNIYVQKIIRQ